MVLSMTGYGRAGALLHGRDIKVELRSVNARFFEYSSRLPRSCAFLEDSAVVIAPLIPWSIAGAVPLVAVGAPESSVLFALFLYLLPLWDLLIKK